MRQQENSVEVEEYECDHEATIERLKELISRKYSIFSTSLTKLQESILAHDFH